MTTRPAASFSLLALLLARPVVNFVLLPLLGAFHGWLTNSVAVWLLFEPIEPVRIPLTRWRIQGILPRRKAELGAQIGRAVEQELLGWQDLVTNLASPRFVAQIAVQVESVVHARVAALVPGFVPGALRERLGQIAGEAAARESVPMVQDLLLHAGDLAQEHVPIAQLVADRVAAFSAADLERLIRRAASEELRAIVQLGFVMGLLIGLVQGLFLEVIGQ